MAMESAFSRRCRSIRWLRRSVLALLFILMLSFVSCLVPIMPYAKLKSDGVTYFLLFSPDGHTLITSQLSDCRTITDDHGQTFVPLYPEKSRLQVWNVDSGKERFILPNRSNYFQQPCISPDSRIICDADLKLWDIRNGEELPLLRPEKDRPLTSFFRFPLDGHFLIEERNKWFESSESPSIHFWDIELKKEIGECPGLFGGMARDGDLTILATISPQVMLWRLAPGRPPKLNRKIPISPVCLALSQDGKQMVSASRVNDYNISNRCEFALWDTATGTKIQAFHHKIYGPIPPLNLSFFADSKLLYVFAGSKTFFIDFTSASDNSGILPADSIVSPDGRWVVANDYEATWYKMPAMTTHGALTARKSDSHRGDSLTGFGRFFSGQPFHHYS